MQFGKKIIRKKLVILFERGIMFISVTHLVSGIYSEPWLYNVQHLIKMLWCMYILVRNINKMVLLNFDFKVQSFIRFAVRWCIFAMHIC
jgi:hypothetical protein